MYGIMLVLHVFICVALIIAVLLQSSKGEGLAGAFASSSLTGTVFGGRGAATFLSKATTGLAVAFFASAIVLSFLHPVTGQRSALEGQSAVEEASRELPPPPAEPATPSQTDQGTAQPGQPAQQQPPPEAVPIEQMKPLTGDTNKR